MDGDEVMLREKQAMLNADESRDLTRGTAESGLVEDHINQWQFAASEMSAADKGREDTENRYGESTRNAPRDQEAYSTGSIH